ncbi:MAG: TlpA disulfide reductase family protein [Aquabacterium sp.]|jgi:thiol-disulfide isomerase/thioredoxin|uniref:TlpA disulfide reductase family protein n=1 Tax=Aquabacterium sp. TaxID=1872578 RepID=UPI002A369013|nr:TlpA disulfide reductase family protein [Aquabacterium sp.]MDX9842502.1 TlpA disulfide reductase family protein [Aquabacterium sp.]
MTARRHLPATPALSATPLSASAQRGQARRALLITAGLGAALAGGWLAWRRDRQPTTEATAPSQVPPPAEMAASAPLIDGDQLTAAFWRQQFDTPQGTSLAWSALQGQPIVLNFWATWCPPCVKEMPELDRFHREFSAKGWKVVGLAVDGPTPVREFLAKVQVGFDIGLAGFGGTELAQTLGNTVGGLPFTVLIDAQGRVRHRIMGVTDLAQLSEQARRIQPG